MLKPIRVIPLIALLFSLICSTPAAAQDRKGTLTGQVTDTSHGVLRGARVELEPKGQPVTTDSQGQFTVSNLDAGAYTVTISFVGMAPYTAQATVTAGEVTQLNVELTIASATDSVIVTAERAYGEAESINRGARPPTTSCRCCRRK